jgi:molecular chaperone GrpE
MTKENPTSEEGWVSEVTETQESPGVEDAETLTEPMDDDGGVDGTEATGGVRESEEDSGDGLQFPGGEGDEEEGPDPVHAELARLRDQHLRLAADFENYRKRATADLAGVWARARADLVRSLVQGLDDLQRVSQFTSEDTTVDALIEGVDLVERNLLKALTEAGLEVLIPVGERFDPNTMEAMMRVPTEEDGLDETVHQVFQKGYVFKDQLVRPARVSVYKDDD